MHHSPSNAFPTGEAHSAAAPSDIVAPLIFIKPQAEKPVFHSQAYTGGEVKYFFEVESHAVPIADLRPQASSFDLERAGFAFLEVPTAVDDLYDDAEVEGAYFQEIEALLKRKFGASEVAIFDATRRSDARQGAGNKDGNRGPASRIHVDYTAKSGPQRARHVLGSVRFEALLARGARIVQVNVWRPIRGPVARSPLALADASSIEAADLVATDQVFPDRIGEIYHLAYHPAQRWYYAPAMTRDEILLIKGWDSLEDGRARFTPHAAFPLPEQDPAAPARESIEVRTMVVIG